MRDDLRRIAHAGLNFNAPLSSERAEQLILSLAIFPGGHVLDLGCGWGELMLRMLAAHPATTGTGVDSDRSALDRGRKLAVQRGLHWGAMVSPTNPLKGAVRKGWPSLRPK